MKKTIARGATLFLVVLMALTLFIPVFASAENAEKRSEYTIVNKTKADITAELNEETYALTITNNNYLEVSNIHLEISYSDYNIYTGAFNIDGMKSIKVDLTQFIRKEALENNDFSIGICPVSIGGTLGIVFLILVLSVLIVLGAFLIAKHITKRMDL